MKRTVISLLILVMPIFGVVGKTELTQKEREYLQKKKVITMCVDPEWMPYERIEKGQHIGMAADYMKIISNLISTPIRLVPTKSWSESISCAQKRECDIYSLAMSTPQRRTYMDFTRPYLSIPLVITTRIDELFIADITQVLDRKLGVSKGYAFAELLRLKYPAINLVEVENINEGLTRVAQGELYGFVGTLSTVGYQLQKSYIGELKVAGKFDDRWELGIGVRNDDPILLAILDKAIASLDSGTKQHIFNKWISVKYDTRIDYTLLWQIGAILLLIVAFLVYRQHELQKYNSLLQKLSVTDKLTSLYNRQKIDEALHEQLELYFRYQKPFSVLIADVDHFKRVNDTFGHLVGDEVLKFVADYIRSHCRATDIVGRWGGEEFIIISPQTELEGMRSIAEKIRLAIAEHECSHDITLTVSIGVTQVNIHDNFNSIIKRVDDALYDAKERGRNCVTAV